MSSFVNGLIGGLIAFGLVQLADRSQKSARVDPKGWRTLRAGWLLNGIIAAYSGFAALIAYFFLEGGSARADAQTQNTVALFLLMAFGAVAIYTLWTSYGRRIMWKGNDLRVRVALGPVVVRRLSDVCSVKKNDVLGEYRLKFRDGSTLRLSAYFHGSKELVAKLPKRVRGRQA